LPRRHRRGRSCRETFHHYSGHAELLSLGQNPLDAATRRASI
jgi:hypothetical protein